ncbi:hypothetical protein BH11BAC4_BH11BAC4_17020 [soil metagenome]
MKKIFILVMLAFSTVAGFSQSLDDIRDLLNKKDNAGAKSAVDKYLADEKNASKAEAWYLKGRAYNAYSNEKSAPESEIYNLKNTAFESFKKSQLLDPKDVAMKLESYTSYLDLYFSLYDLGANYFNSKNYEAAYSSFKKSLDVESYILSKQYTYTQATLHPLDTALVLNTAVAATQAKKDDEAVTYYKKITDGNVGGDNYKEVYEFLVNYYSNKEDAAALAAILGKAKKFYPANDYWNQVELDKIGKTGDKAALYAKYEEMIAKDPANFALAYNYSVELYNTNYGPNSKPDDASKEKLSTVLKAAIANDQGIDATVLMANLTYNLASDAQSAKALIKGVKPEDKKKKDEFNAIANKKMDECIVYSEQIVKYYESKAELKGRQVGNLKIVLGYLSEIYKIKGDPKKAAEYEKKSSLVK